MKLEWVSFDLAETLILFEVNSQDHELWRCGPLSKLLRNKYFLNVLKSRQLLKEKKESEFAKILEEEEEERSKLSVSKCGCFMKTLLHYEIGFKRRLETFISN